MPQGNIVPHFAGRAVMPGKEGGQEGRGRQAVGCPRHCCRLLHRLPESLAFLGKASDCQCVDICDPTFTGKNHPSARGEVR
jgi:hypothetical protein